MTKQNTTKKDLYEEVTNKMIALLEQGVAPWKCTWNKYGMARNYASKRTYSGINAILMNFTPHPIPYFLSFKQAKQLGGKVKKGATSEKVYFYKTLFKDESGQYVNHTKAQALNGMGEEVQTIPVLRCYSVFNIQDIEGIEFDIPEVELKDHQIIENYEAIFNNMPNAPQFVFENADRACYNPISDKLNMPDIKQFETVEDYYCTLFHEMTHATGHKSRLNRKEIMKFNPFGSKAYSKEELVAEMGASFLCAHVGINCNDITENSAAYLQGWLSALKADKKLIFKAAAKAQKAVDYILNVKRSYEE
ncbi:MAG: zincin-like metallopeptidase domain-containing protein [Saprospiraceae bacterium]|nr:zincin-like metallopeptidase domain-containing protein [Saprospiraceae bacterium]